MIHMRSFPYGWNQGKRTCETSDSARLSLWASSLIGRKPLPTLTPPAALRRRGETHRRVSCLHFMTPLGLASNEHQVRFSSTTRRNVISFTALSNATGACAGFAASFESRPRRLKGHDSKPTLVETVRVVMPTWCSPHTELNNPD